MGTKTEINVQPIIDRIKAELSYLGVATIFRGRNSMEGHILIKFVVDDHRDLEIDIDVIQMLKTPKYLDNLMENIHNLNDKSLAQEFEACRLTGY